MRMAIRIVVTFLMAFSAVAVLAQSDGLQPSRIAVIKAAPATYLNERVRIDGFVTQFVDAGSKSTSFFYLKDDWGAVIKVRTSKESPSVGKRYSIEGPVGLDPRTKDLYVSEESRLELVKVVEKSIALNDVPVASPPQVPSNATVTATTNTATQSVSGQLSVPVTTTTDAVKPPGTSWIIYLLIGATVVIVLIAVVFLTIRARRDEAQTTEYSIMPASQIETPPPPEQIIEGKTIKLHAPPPNTVKLLPGWFEILSGDDIVKQIRFYKLGGDRGAETTFGRASGRPYAHIQLKAPTVSSRQAKVTFDNGTAQLTNFASADSNPTKVNGRDLDVNESIPLSENDRVEMGEISMLFHALPMISKTANA